MSNIDFREKKQDSRFEPIEHKIEAVEPVEQPIKAPEGPGDAKVFLEPTRATKITDTSFTHNKLKNLDSKSQIHQKASPSSQKHGMLEKAKSADNFASLQGSKPESPPAEECSFVIKIENKLESLARYNNWKARKLAFIDKRVLRVIKYFNKMLKSLAEKQPEFAKKFTDPMKENMEVWEGRTTQDKIFGVLLSFEKLLVVVQHSGLLRFFKEKIYKKLLVLIKKYLTCLNTFRTHFYLEAEKMLDEHNLLTRAELDDFRRDLVVYGFERIAKEEADKMRVSCVLSTLWESMDRILRDSAAQIGSIYPKKIHNFRRNFQFLTFARS